jgi:sigma-B regulation protein RsbU (phosphoserine phosphatase)
MNNGAFDFATKPIDLDDLSLTIKKAIEHIKYIKNMQKDSAQLESLKGDLAIASEIQQAILPRIFPPFPENAQQLDIAASMHAAKDVGGDFYDFFRIDDDHIGFSIADVSGKGIPAAIFMAVSRTLIRATGIRGGNPSDCITYSNKLLATESVDCMFVTVFYGIYTISTGEISYCNAGHNPPIVLKADGTAMELPMPQDPLMGALEDMTYHDVNMKLEPGETLVMFTDGVNEAMNKDFQEFGDDRLIASLQKCSGQNCQQIIDSVKADVASFVGEMEQSDDITLFALKRLK